MKISFRNYIFGILIFVSILLIIFMNILVFVVSKNEMKEEKLKNYEMHIKNIEYYLDRFIEEKYRDIEALLVYLNLSDFSNSNKKKVEAKRLLSLKPEIRYVLFLDKDGIIRDCIPYREDIIGIDLSNNPMLKWELDVKFHGPHISIIDKIPYYVISKSLPYGKILALINIPGINSLIETLKLHDYYTFIVNDKGLVLAHVDEEIVNQGINLSHYSFIKEGIAGRESLLDGEINEEKYIFLARKISKTNYTFFIGEKYEQALGSFYNLQEMLIYIFISFIFFVFLVSLIISQRFTKPVKRIIDTIERIKKGEYRVSQIKSNIDELEEISKTLSQMVQIIADRETKLRKIFESSADCIALVTKEGDILDINEEGIKMFGYSDKSEMLKIKTSQTYVDISDREKYLKKLEEKGYVKNFEVPLKKKNGEIFFSLISSSMVKDENGNILFIITTIKDITEKRKLQEQLFQAQKMESIGRLAGSIAHDFNNILSVIHGSNQLLQIYAKDNPQIEKYTSNITKGVEKAKDFIKKLLYFSKKQPFVFKTCDLNEIIKEEIKLLKPTIREDITLELKTLDYPLFVNLDRSQFTQIFLNLTVNAMDAMPEGGQIKIETEEKNFEYEHIKNYPFVKAGSFACIIFSDTGIGIPKEIMDRIFEPFFTTKPEGTGLGLATVYGIVQQHKGFINVYSEEGKGTTFRIYLPLLKASDHVIENEGKEIDINIRKILLVEDNDDVRAVIEEILRTNGFEVYSFANGLEALNRYNEIKDTLELCLFDIVMPSIGGFELYKKIREIKPDIKVLFMTGYADNLTQIHTILKEGQQIINKPFSIAELKKKIKEMF